MLQINNDRIHRYDKNVWIILPINNIIKITMIFKLDYKSIVEVFY